MKKSAALWVAIVWVVFSLLYDLGIRYFLRSDLISGAEMSQVPSHLLWIQLPGYFGWAALTLLFVWTVYEQVGQSRASSILLLLLGLLAFVLLTYSGSMLLSALFVEPASFHAFYVDLVSVEPSFLRLDAMLLAGVGFLGLFRQKAHSSQG